MDEAIQWKEAKGGRRSSDSEDISHRDAGSDELNNSDQESLSEPDDRSLVQDRGANQPTVEGRHDRQQSRSFSHRNINLVLRRNTVALADCNQHKPKSTYASDSKTEPFDSWLENALVTISPNADLLLFSSNSPEKITFLAKLRMDPINQYVTKSLQIPLDYDEQVTSLLCLPIMSKQKTALGLVDWTALVIGLSSGYVKFYTEQSICLLSLKFCDEPVMSLKCQTLKQNSNARSESHFATIVDEILLTFRTTAVIVDGLGLYENLRIAKDEVLGNGPNYEPAYSLTNLPCILNCQKWKLDYSRDSLVMDADLSGTRRISTFNSMLSDSINFEHIPAKKCGRAILFAGRNPFLSYYREPEDSGGHTYTELIGSIFTLWNKPQPTRTQIAELPKCNSVSIFDRERLATRVCTSPDKRLAAVTDDFGRVMLVDITNLLVVRLWKGYRGAQCGWIEVQRNPEKRGSPHASFLIIYAPKRGLLEIWSAQRGPRVAAFNVGKGCRLLYSGYRMLNMRGEHLLKNGNINQLAEQSYSSNCYLLNGKSETIFTIDLPYTYSLYKLSDLKSRDRLLINELVIAMQRDSEIGVISETLHRITLAESQQTCIEKMALTLMPNKIVPILENLINKTMRNYDNHAGEILTNDDESIIELCKRLIRLCSVFEDLSKPIATDLTLPDVNQRLIEEYEEHPQEVDEFSEKLGWSTTEILRYLSLLALERSYRKRHLSNPWPSMGEPLTWPEFISCFDLTRMRISRFKSSRKPQVKRPDKVLIKLKEFSHNFLNEDKVVKTALFMYNRLSEAHYKSSQTSAKNSSEIIKRLNCTYNFLEPSNRLALLFQFWLTTKLCNHWKMWDFLQAQVGQISDELRVIAMDQGDDKVLIETWKHIYGLVLDSDNIFAAITATAAIRSDTIRMIHDNEKREKLEEKENVDCNDEPERRSSVDWECLCIDAERMSLLSQQLEDIFLLNLLLRYSVNEGRLVEGFYYRLPRLSVANILRKGGSIVSELVAQWAAQSGVSLKIFMVPYGAQDEEEKVVISGTLDSNQSLSGQTRHSKLFSAKRQDDLDNEEHAKELLHHTKTSFPLSLEADKILLNCFWEFCRQWISNPTISNRLNPLRSAFDCLSLLSSAQLRQKLASVAYKTFFQRIFERLVILVETNSTLMCLKSSRIRDKLTRKELNIGEECLEEFVSFCCDLSELMLETCGQAVKANVEQEEELRAKLLASDSWWAQFNVNRMLDERAWSSEASTAARNIESQPSTSWQQHQQQVVTSDGSASSSLVRIILFSSNILDINSLVELNRLANLMNLIFRLNITKAYPMLLIGEEARQVLKFDLQQSSSSGSGGGGAGSAINMKNLSASLGELRQKFARKCIMNIVCKLTEETSGFSEEEEDDDYNNDFDDDATRYGTEAIDAKLSSVFTKSKSASSSRQQQVGTSSDPLSSSSRHKRSQIGSNTGANSGLLKGDVTTMSTISKDENNESMVLFANLLSLASEWKLNCEELHLELVFELYRCNHDKIGSQISNRIGDQQTLANGLLKISSQRVLVLSGLSPNISGSEWRHRSDKWSIFQPNLASWLKGIQQEEMKRELAALSFSSSLKCNRNVDDDDDEDYDDSYQDDQDRNDKQPVSGNKTTTKKNSNKKSAFGLQIYVLHSLRKRTKLLLERATNHLDGQAARLAYDLLQLLDSRTLDSLLGTVSESELLSAKTTS